MKSTWGFLVQDKTRQNQGKVIKGCEARVPEGEGNNEIVDGKDEKAAATGEDSWAASDKTKHTLTVRTSNCAP